MQYIAWKAHLFFAASTIAVFAVGNAELRSAFMLGVIIGIFYWRLAVAEIEARRLKDGN